MTSPSLILLAIEDITDRKHAEQELKALNQTLEDRVSRRTAEAESRAKTCAIRARACEARRGCAPSSPRPPMPSSRSTNTA